VVVHRFDRNLGFAAPYDEVARRSDSDFLVFLNNDTKVEPTWLAELVSALGVRGEGGTKPERNRRSRDRESEKKRPEYDD